MTWQTLYQNGVLGACQRVFGEPVVFKLANGTEHQVSGIFNQMYQSVDPNTNAIVQSHQPNIGVRRQDLPSKPTRSDFFIVRGITYRVVEDQQDGEGDLHILLHRHTAG